MKANDNLTNNALTGSHQRVSLPVPPLEACSKVDMEIYAKFMRHLRHVANSREDIKVLSAIQFTADMMDMQDGEVAGVLVSMGLRSPRAALPAAFLESADNALMRDEWEAGAAGQAVRELRDHWNLIGEDRFAAFKRHYPTLTESLFTRV